MPKRTDIQSVLVIGSGPIVIGQAAEFDYSGTQACRVLRGRGPAGHPGQLQPGDDHDRPGDRRRHLRRADHPRVRREDHRQGAPGRAAAHPGRPDRAQHRDLPARGRRPREVRRRADRRQRRGHQQGRGPRPLQGGRRGRPREDRHGESARSVICHSMDDVLAGVDDARGYPVVVRPSFTMGGAGSGFAYDEDELRRIAGQGLHALADHRGAPGGVHPRLEGVRAGADARQARQRRGRLLHRELRPDGRAHRRLDHRRARDDADRPRVPAAARRRHRDHPRGRRRHRRLQHPVRGQPGRRPAHRHRDEPAGVPLLARWRPRPPASRSPRSPPSWPSATPSTRSPTTSPRRPRPPSSRRSTTSSSRSRASPSRSSRPPTPR